MISSVKIHHISNGEVNWLPKMAELELRIDKGCKKSLPPPPLKSRRGIGMQMAYDLEINDSSYWPFNIYEQFKFKLQLVNGTQCEVSKMYPDFKIRPRKCRKSRFPQVHARHLGKSGSSGFF